MPIPFQVKVVDVYTDADAGGKMENSQVMCGPLLFVLYEKF